MANINTPLFIRHREKFRVSEKPDRLGPSAWMGVPREGFTAHQMRRLKEMDTPEGRKHQPVVLDALPVNGKRR